MVAGGSTEVPAPVLLSELVGAFHRMAEQWGITGGDWMEEKRGEEERAASELGSQMEARLTDEYASADFGMAEEGAENEAENETTLVAAAMQEWDRREHTCVWRTEVRFPKINQEQNKNDSPPLFKHTTPKEDNLTRSIMKFDMI